MNYIIWFLIGSGLTVITYIFATLITQLDKNSTDRTWCPSIVGIIMCTIGVLSGPITILLLSQTIMIYLDTTRFFDRIDTSGLLNWMLKPICK